MKAPGGPSAAGPFGRMQIGRERGRASLRDLHREPTQTAVRSPARSSRARETASWRFVSRTVVFAVEPVGDPPYDAAHVGGRSIDLTEEPNFPLPACLCNREGISQLGHIDASL